MRQTGTFCATGAIISLFASCTTLLPYAKPIEPVAVLTPDAAFFIRADRAVLEAAAVLFMDSADAKSAAPILERTVLLHAALQPDGKGGMIFETVAEGSYPSGIVSASLSANKDWIKEGPGFTNRVSGLRIAFADDRVAVAANVPLDSLASRLGEPGINPLPPEFQEAWNSSIAIFIPDAGTFLNAALGQESATVPLQAMLVSGVFSGNAYDCQAQFLFADERSAKVYAPLCKLMLYAALRNSGSMPTSVWTWDGRMLKATSLRLDAQAFIRLGTAVIAPRN